MNPAAFATPRVATTVGQTDYSVLGGGPDQARGPNCANLDASLFKNFTFTETWRAQLRIEAFNALNMTEFGQPGSLNYTTPTNFSLITGLRGSPRISPIVGKIFF